MTPTDRHTADAFDQIEQLVVRLRQLEPVLRHRAATTDRDGYPRSSAPDAGHHSTTGDPVGALVVLRVDDPRGDPIAHAHHRLVSYLDQARRLLELAESAGQQALPPPTARTEDDGCVSCRRTKTWSPISRAGRCRWCSDWAYQHQGEDPPVDILRAHHQGRRITTHLAGTITRRRR